MDKDEFASIRVLLGKTQKELSELLGTSVKGIQSYEQGWRAVPTHIERQVLFLLSRKKKTRGRGEKCWTIKNCPATLKNSCPAHEFQSGDLCWFINGTNCNGVTQRNWDQKIKMCRSCEVFHHFVLR